MKYTNKHGIDLRYLVCTQVAEVSAVFGAYGIGVDPRHLSLISDHVTHQVGGAYNLRRSAMKTFYFEGLCFT